MAQVYVQVLFLLIPIIVSTECGDIQTGSAHEAVALFEVNSDELESCYRVRVIKYTTENKPTVIFEWPKKAQQDKRMSWETDGNTLMSFHLKNLQKSDEGMYSCEIWQGWDPVQIRNTTLKVKDCKTLPAVKVKPDSSARLQCSVDITSDQRRPQNVSWAMLKGFNHVAVDSQRVEIDNTSLIIQTVSHSDSGWYRCHYVLGQTKYCLDVRLNVQEGAEDTPEFTTAPNTPTPTLQGSNQEAESRTSMISVVASVSFGLMAAALLGLFFYCRQQRRRVTTPPQIAGTPTMMINNYVNRSPPDLQDPEYQRINSVYYSGDERLHNLNY